MTKTNSVSSADMSAFLELANKLGISNVIDNALNSTSSKSYAGITPYNLVPPTSYKVGGYSNGKFIISMPYSKAPSSDQKEKNVLEVFRDEAQEFNLSEIVSIRGYVVEYNHTHGLSKFGADKKYKKYCECVGQLDGTDVTNTPISSPIRYMYTRGKENNYAVPSPSLEASKAMGSRGLSCAECIRMQENRVDEKTRCEERGNLIFYITQLGVKNKKNKTIDYTHVSDLYFASTWDINNVFRMSYIPANFTLSRIYLQGVIGDEKAGIEPVCGFDEHLNKMRRACSSDFFNPLLFQTQIDVTSIPGASINQLSFTSAGRYLEDELNEIVTHWNEVKPEFVETRVPLSKYSSLLRANYTSPSSNTESYEQKTQQQQSNTDLNNF